MDWFHKVIPADSVAGGLATLSVAVVLGLALGTIRVRGIGLGVAAVFFSSMALAAMGLRINSEVLQFLRDFSMIIFIYTIGLQVGPSFFGSLRAEGLKLNLLSLLTIALGAIMTLAMVWMLKLPGASSAGLFAGAFATPPGLGAAQEAVRSTLSGESASTANRIMSMAYAISYPFGLVGPIFLIVIFRWMFKVNVAAEVHELSELEAARRPPIEHVDIEVTNPGVVGMALSDLRCVRERGVILTRLLRNNVLSAPAAMTKIELGDHIRAVGTAAVLPGVIAEFGHKSSLDLSKTGAGDFQLLRLVVTNRKSLRKMLQDLHLPRRFGVTIARIDRAGIQLEPRASSRLMFGDIVSAVGRAEGIKAVEDELGNSKQALDTPQLIPIFLGFVFGVLAGSIPLEFPGMGSDLRLGLAGGPMIVAILLSRLGNVGPLVWYMPGPAQTLFRDFGMAVFLACVGLSAGSDLGILMERPSGLLFILWGALITLVPMFIVGWIARTMFKMNFVTLSGLVAGAMTNSPSLLFANDLSKSREPAVAYAAVYPLATLLPIFAAQVLVTLCT